MIAKDNHVIYRKPWKHSFWSYFANHYAMKCTRFEFSEVILCGITNLSYLSIASVCQPTFSSTLPPVIGYLFIYLWRVQMETEPKSGFSCTSKVNLVITHPLFSPMTAIELCHVDWWSACDYSSISCDCVLHNDGVTTLASGVTVLYNDDVLEAVPLEYLYLF